MPLATTEVGVVERIVWFAEKYARLTVRRATKVLRDPSVVLRKVFGPRSSRPTRAERAQSPVARRNDRPLQPGDRVRVRPYDAIQATLDDAGTCGGMAFLPIVMAKCCGGTYTVRHRVQRFFDERRWKMLKLRDAVILDGVYCQPPREAGVDWAGCDRSCFLFWKETWLERVDEP